MSPDTFRIIFESEEYYSAYDKIIFVEGEHEKVTTHITNLYRLILREEQKIEKLLNLIRTHSNFDSIIRTRLVDFSKKVAEHNQEVKELETRMQNLKLN